MSFCIAAHWQHVQCCFMAGKGKGCIGRRYVGASQQALVQKLAQLSRLSVRTVEVHTTWPVTAAAMLPVCAGAM